MTEFSARWSASESLSPDCRSIAERAPGEERAAAAGSAAISSNGNRDSSHIVGCASGTDRDVARQLREPSHLDPNVPRSIRDVGEPEDALRVGRRRQAYVALRRCDRGSRNGIPPKMTCP